MPEPDIAAPLEEETYAAFGARLFQAALHDRRPVIGSMALTHRCNLRCVHCYLQDERDRVELSTEAWCDLLDQVAEAGCLWLVLTGGEPLLREDFARIYRHAKHRGFLIYLFTNGTLLDDATADLLCEQPPHAVEISLYAATAETYREVTGCGWARDAAYSAVARLGHRGVTVRCKTVALRHNVHELDQLQADCQSLGTPFKFDTMVTPGLDGGQAPCAARLDAEQAIALDVEDGSRLAAWRALRKLESVPRRALYSCGAGQTTFHVDASGGLALCNSSPAVFDLKQGTFLQGWRGAVAEHRTGVLPAEHPCRDCRDQLYCGVCPPLARMESGSELGFPSSWCELGRSRRNAIQARLDPSPGAGGSPR